MCHLHEPYGVVPGWAMHNVFFEMYQLSSGPVDTVDVEMIHCLTWAPNIASIIETDGRETRRASACRLQELSSQTF